MNESGSPGRSFSARGPALAFLLCAWLGAAGLVFDAPARVVGGVVAPVLFCGAAYPWLIRHTPGEAGLSKLALFGGLLSPALLTGLDALLRYFAAPRAALVVSLLSIGASQLLVGRRRWRARGPSKAELCFLLSALVAVSFAIWLALQAPVLWTTGDGVWHAGRIDAWRLGSWAENPWLVGVNLVGPDAYARLSATLAASLGLSPSSAQSVLTIWAIAGIAGSTYFLAAAFGRFLNPAPVSGVWIVACALAPLGLGALALFDSGAHGVLGWSTLFLASPVAPALALALGAWVAAQHALRHARAPWVLLCGVLHGLALLLDTGIGGGALAATACAAVLAPGVSGSRYKTRPGLLASLALCALPGIAGIARGAPPGPFTGVLELASWPVAFVSLGAFLPAILLLPPSRGRLARDSRPALWLLVFGLISATLAARFIPVELGARPPGAVLLAAVAGGLLAGLGLCSAWKCGGLSIAGAIASGALLTIGGLAQIRTELVWMIGFADAEGQTSAGAAALEPRARRSEFAVLGAYDLLMLSQGVQFEKHAALDAHDIEAYARLREWCAGRDPRPVLLIGDAREEQRLGYARFPHPAPLFSGAVLWADRTEPQASEHPQTAKRVRLSREMFADDPRALTAILVELERLERTGLFWVGAAERDHAPGLEGGLKRAGAAALFESGPLTIYAWPGSALEGVDRR